MAMVMTSMMSEESGDDHVVGVKPSSRNTSLASNGTAGGLSDMEGGGAVAAKKRGGTGAALALFGGGGGGGVFGGADEGAGASRRADILEEDRRTRRWQVERTAARLNRVCCYVTDRNACSSWME